MTDKLFIIKKGDQRIESYLSKAEALRELIELNSFEDVYALETYTFG